MRDGERKEAMFLLALDERKLSTVVEKMEVDDMVIYRGFQEIGDIICSIIVLLDDAFTNTIAYIVGDISDEENREEILEIANRFNNSYELGKFYINNSDEVCGQISYISDADQFDGALFLDLLIHRLMFIKDEFYPTIKHLIKN